MEDKQPQINPDMILRRAIETFGVESQIYMAIEEMAELTKALCKWRRATAEYKPRTADAIREEMADVNIMLWQLTMIFGDPIHIVDQKLARLAGRLEEKSHEI